MRWLYANKQVLSLLYPLSLPQNCNPSKDLCIRSSSKSFWHLQKPAFAKILIVELPLNALGAEAPTCKDDGFIFSCQLLAVWLLVSLNTAFGIVKILL